MPYRMVPVDRYVQAAWGVQSVRASDNQRRMPSVGSFDAVRCGVLGARQQVVQLSSIGYVNSLQRHTESFGSS